VFILLVLITYVYHNARLKTRKVLSITQSNYNGRTPTHGIQEQRPPLRCLLSSETMWAKSGKEPSDKNDVPTAAQVNHNAAKRKTLKFLSRANSANAKNSSSISHCNIFQLNGILFHFLKASAHRKRSNFAQKYRNANCLLEKHDLNKNTVFFDT
jgi:hypothetical protein